VGGDNKKYDTMYYVKGTTEASAGRCGTARELLGAWPQLWLSLAQPQTAPSRKDDFCR